MIILYDILNNDKAYFKLFDKHYEKLTQGFEREEIRKELIEFKFYEADKKIRNLTRTRFIYNLIMFLPYIRLGYRDDIKLDKSMILDFDNLDNDMIANFIDEKVIKNYYDREPEEINKALTEWRSRIKFTQKFSKIIGHNYSLHDEILKFDRDESYREILRTRIDETQQPKAVEAEIREISKQLMDNLENDEKHPFRPMLKCNEGVRIEQLNEYFVNAGSKPNIYGRIIPIYLNINYLYHGIDSVGRYFVDANSGNKAAIMNDEYIGSGGYLSRKMVLASIDTHLSKDPNSECLVHIDNLPRIIIKSQAYLDRLIGRYYMEEDGINARKFKLLDPEKDQRLIGKTIILRTPATCSNKEICYKCYGKLAKFNKNFHLGISSTSRLSRPIIQKVMSAKHLLQSNSYEMEFDEEFKDYFELSGNIININTELENLDGFTLRMSESDISGDSDELYGSYIDTFRVIINDTGEVIDIREKNNMRFYITPALDYILNKKKFKSKEFVDLPFTDIANVESDLDVSENEYLPLFNIELLNHELTKPLHDLKELLDLNKKRKFETLDDMYQMAFDLMIEAKIDSQFNAFEVVARSLIRLKDDILERPDFNTSGFEYKILTISTSLSANPSPMISLAFEDIKRQLLKPATYKKNKPSMIDKFFHVMPTV